MKTPSKYFIAPRCMLCAFWIVANSVSVVSAVAQPKSEPLKGAASSKVSAFEGGVRFVLPPGYRALSKAEIARKFPAVGAPQYVWAGDKNLSATVALTLDPTRVKPSDLPALMEAMRATLQRDQPDIQWLQREFITLNDQRWIRFEFVSKAVDTRIYNDLYFTSFNKQLLIFNFNATLTQRERLAPLFQKCRDSIELQASGKA